MITEMVIAVAYGDIKCYTAIELTQVVFHIATILEDEVNNIQISVACLGITTVCQPQKGHG